MLKCFCDYIKHICMRIVRKVFSLFCLLWLSCRDFFYVTKKCIVKMGKYACYLFSRLISIQMAINQKHHPHILWIAIDYPAPCLCALIPLGPSKKKKKKYKDGLLGHCHSHHRILFHLSLTLYLLSYSLSSWGLGSCPDFLSSYLSHLACVEGCHSCEICPQDSIQDSHPVLQGLLGVSHVLPDLDDCSIDC